MTRPLLLHSAAAAGAYQIGHTVEEEPCRPVELSQRSHGGTGVSHRILLFNRYGCRQIFNSSCHRPWKPLQILPGIRREGLYEPAL